MDWTACPFPRFSKCMHVADPHPAVQLFTHCACFDASPVEAGVFNFETAAVNESTHPCRKWPKTGPFHEGGEIRAGCEWRWWASSIVIRGSRRWGSSRVDLIRACDTHRLTGDVQARVPSAVNALRHYAPRRVVVLGILLGHGVVVNQVPPLPDTDDTTMEESGAVPPCTEGRTA